MDVMLARLVRNNGWVMERYAPESMRRPMLRDLRRRYRVIARKENAIEGYAAGLLELKHTIRRQDRRPMPRELFERFMGLSYAREALNAAMAQHPFATAQVVDEGKNGWVVRRALDELGVRVLNAPPYGVPSLTCSPSQLPTSSPPHAAPDAIVIGTMSPGPMLDAYERRTAMPVQRGPRVIAPWRAVTERAVPRPLEVLTADRRAAAARTRIPA
jgi:hypothetical protein